MLRLKSGSDGKESLWKRNFADDWHVQKITSSLWINYCSVKNDSLGPFLEAVLPDGWCSNEKDMMLAYTQDGDPVKVCDDAEMERNGTTESFGT